MKFSFSACKEPRLVPGLSFFLWRVSRRFPPGSVELPARRLRFPPQPTFSCQVKSKSSLEFVPFVRAGRYAACSNRASPLIELPLRVACSHLPLNLGIGRPFLSSIVPIPRLARRYLSIPFTLATFSYICYLVTDDAFVSFNLRATSS